MTLDLAYEIWQELKRFINSVDRSEAAETLVVVLIDNDMDADDIKDVFKGDIDIKRALTSYLDNDKDYAEEDEEEDYDSDYNEDENWEN